MYQIAKLTTSIVECCSLKWTADCIELKWFQFLACKLNHLLFNFVAHICETIHFIVDRAAVFSFLNSFTTSKNWIVATCQLWHIPLDIFIVKIFWTEFKSMMVEPFNSSFKIFDQFLHHSIPFEMPFFTRLHLMN